MEKKFFCNFVNCGSSSTFHLLIDQFRMRGLLLVGALGLEFSFLLLFGQQAASVVGGFGILSQEENSFTESLIPGLIFSLLWVVVVGWVGGESRTIC